MAHPDCIIKEGDLICTWEKKYIQVGLAFIITGPLQAIICYVMLVSHDFDLIAAEPIFTLLAWLIPSSILQHFVWKIGGEHADRFRNYHHITAFPLFSIHAGILILFRMTVIILIRLITGKRGIRHCEPYLLWLPPVP